MSDQDKFLWELAWKHFNYHADQRLKAFNFFVVVITFILAGAFAALAGKMQREVGLIAGIALVFLPWIFYGLDQRNRQLIKLAEKALADFEHKFPSASRDPQTSIGLFSIADQFLRTNKPRLVLTYNQSFRAFYILSGGIGFLLLASSALNTPIQ